MTLRVCVAFVVLALAIPDLVQADALSVSSTGKSWDTGTASRAVPAVLTSSFRVFGETARPVSAVPPGRYRHEQKLAKGVFLIASRGLNDSNFSQTVVLLVDYDPQAGALGIVINRPTKLMLSQVLPRIEELENRPDIVFVGGPVAQDRILLILRTQDPPDGAEHVFGNIYVSATEDVLRQMLDRKDPDDSFHAYVGYAGWAPGQLDAEVARGDWHLSVADAEVVFDNEPSAIWPELIRQNSGRWVKGGARVPRLMIAALATRQLHGWGQVETP